MYLRGRKAVSWCGEENSRKICEDFSRRDAKNAKGRRRLEGGLAKNEKRCLTHRAHREEMALFGLFRES
jgi:hypothetical protein